MGTSVWWEERKQMQFEQLWKSKEKDGKIEQKEWLEMVENDMRAAGVCVCGRSR